MCFSSLSTYPKVRDRSFSVPLLDGAVLLGVTSTLRLQSAAGMPPFCRAISGTPQPAWALGLVSCPQATCACKCPCSSTGLDTCPSGEIWLLPLFAWLDSPLQCMVRVFFNFTPAYLFFQKVSEKVSPYLSICFTTPSLSHHFLIGEQLRNPGPPTTLLDIFSSWVFVLFQM